MKNKKGFTFVEIMVVVLIIGILTAITVPGYKVSTMKARIVNNMTLMRSLQNDILNFYNINSTLPTSVLQLSVNSSDFQGNTHVPTGCDITVSNNETKPAVSMDCQQGWVMTYRLQSVPVGYTLGEKLFIINGGDSARLHQIAHNFGWSGSGNTYTIK